MERSIPLHVECQRLRVIADFGQRGLLECGNHHPEAGLFTHHISAGLGRRRDEVVLLLHLLRECARDLNLPAIEVHMKRSHSRHIECQGFLIKVNHWGRRVLGQGRIKELLDLLHVLWPLLAIRLDEPKHKSPHLRGHFCRHGQGVMFVGRWVIVYVARHGRMLECEQVIERGSKGIEVGPRAEFLVAPLHLLARGIAVGIGHSRGGDGASRIGIELLAGAEVDEFDDARPVYHHIGRFEVHVPNSLAMYLLQSFKHLLKHVTHLFLVHGLASALETLLEVLAIDIVHDIVGSPVLIEQVIHPDNVRVMKFAQAQSLLSEFL